MLRLESTVAGTENLNAGHHVVHFYGHDEELAERVAGYLLAALDRDGVALVIATPAHTAAFETRLRRAGADLAGARARGAYLALDAGAALDALMAGDRLDVAAFERVIGGLIERAMRARGAPKPSHAGDGREPDREPRHVPVHAYGEMVALLWEAGLVSAVSQLEAMWDDLCRRHPFSLFCGYQSGQVPNDLDAFAEVCRLHREVIGPAPDGVPGVARAFALTRESPAQARHFTVGTLRGWGIGELCDDAALVVTELAANAVVHARSGFTVSLSARGDRVRISVRDADPRGREALVPVPLHGLGAVDALASRWGVESLGSAGKTVWVELRR